MSDYCYDGAFDSVLMWLEKISGQFKEVEDFNKEFREFAQEVCDYMDITEDILKSNCPLPGNKESKIKPFCSTGSRLCDECRKELSTSKIDDGRVFELCKDCNINDAVNYLCHIEKVRKDEIESEVSFEPSEELKEKIEEILKPKFEEINCPCLGDIVLEGEIVKEGQVIQHVMKCKTCERTGFIKNNTFIYQWDEESNNDN